MTERLRAVVLAAGRIAPDLARETGAEAKALIPVGGRPIIDRVLEALDAAQLVGDVRVVAARDSPLLEHLGPLGVTTAGPAFLDSVRTGLEALGSPDRLLLVTGDLPFITAEALDHFSREALQSGACIVYSIVRKEDCERAFPGGRRLYVRLRDAAYTGGNVGLVSRAFIEEQGDCLARAFAARKNPLRLGAMLGWRVVVRLALGRLSLGDVIARGEQLLGAKLHVAQSPHPEVAFDVDKPANLAAAEAWCAREGRA